jgi:hypothetical protein
LQALGARASAFLGVAARAGLRRRELWRGSGRPPARPTQRDTLMASAAEARALELIAQGDKKLSSYFASFFGNKYEAAEELYTKAANQLKVAKNCAQQKDPVNAQKTV